MSEVTNVEPVVSEVPAPAPVEKVYRYQPTDEYGRKLGGEQVIKYSTEQELAEKLRDQNVLLVRKLREITRKQQLGLQDDTDTIPTEVPRYEGPTQLVSKDLTAEERFQIAQDIQDPEKFNEGRDRLLESAFGVKPEVLRSRLNDIERRQAQQDALQNFQIFVGQTPDFYQSVENNQTLTALMVKNGIAPTVDGFKFAHSKAKAAGLLLDAPPVQEETVTRHEPVTAVETNSQPPVAPESRITPGEQPQTKRQAPVPSGLNDRVSSGTAPRSEGASVTLADIDKLPAAEYKRKLQDPVFRALVNRLEKEALQKRKASMPQE